VVFDHIWDDAWQHDAASTNVNFGGGVRTGLGVFCYGAGPSVDDSGSSSPNPAPESNVFHDFVVDTTVRRVFWSRWGRTDIIGEVESIPFNAHGLSANPAKYDVKRQLYNVTVVTGGRVSDSVHMSPVYSVDGLRIVSEAAKQACAKYGDVGLGLFGSPENLSAGVHRVLNNIIWVKDSRPVARDLYPDAGREIWDGNLLWGWTGRTSQSGYRGLVVFLHRASGVNRTGTAAPYVNSAATLRSAAAPSSTSYYAPGWEANGVTMDPDLDEATLLPRAPGVHAGALDLSGTGWPGTEGYVPQRGCRVPAIG